MYNNLYQYSKITHFIHFSDELNVLEKERTELETDLKNSTDKKLTGKDERQISQLQGLHQKELQIQAQIREEQDEGKKSQLSVFMSSTK